jgi:muconolactone delta-isomerase
MAQFIALLKRNLDHFTEADFTPALLEAEAERARQLYAQGVTRAMWGRKDLPGAVVLIEAESRDAAEGALNSLPLKAKGMLDIEMLIPIGPYRGFGPRG